MNAKDLTRALKNARARALYWSGNPSFTGKRFAPCPKVRRVTGGHSEQYELAMCDIQSLADELERLTGRKRKKSDPKQAFRDKWHAALTRQATTPTTKP